MSQMSERLLAQRLRITDELGTGGAVECAPWEIADALCAWFCDDSCRRWPGWPQGPGACTEWHRWAASNVEGSILSGDSERERELCALLGVSITRL